MSCRHYRCQTSWYLLHFSFTTDLHPIHELVPQRFVVPILAIQIEGVPHRVRGKIHENGRFDVFLGFYLADLLVIPDQLIDFVDFVLPDLCVTLRQESCQTFALPAPASP